MTRRDYEAFAAIIRDARRSSHDGIGTERVISDMIIQMSAVFKADNPRFDTSRFRDACIPVYRDK